jgi:hypothetical protein
MRGACVLPDGKRVVGEMRIVRETVERIVNCYSEGGAS